LETFDLIFLPDDGAHNLSDVKCVKRKLRPRSGQQVEFSPPKAALPWSSLQGSGRCRLVHQPDREDRELLLETLGAPTSSAGLGLFI
jgi:hypothetical protein